MIQRFILKFFSKACASLVIFLARFFLDKCYTVKLGYDEQLRTDQICSLQPGFVITGLIYVVE